MTLQQLKRRSRKRLPLSTEALKVKRLRSAVEAMPVVPSPKTQSLVTQSFPEWCQTLSIKTDGGLMPFELFPWQADFADLVLSDGEAHRTISLLSSRQTGKTSLLLALATYLVLSRRQFTGLLIHRTIEDARNLCRRIKRFLPSEVRLTTDSLSLLEFADTQSSLHFRSSNPSKEDGAEQCGRGLESVDLVIVEEASHTANLQKVVGVVAPCTTWSSLGVMVFVGTAGSKESYYYKHLSKSAGGDNALEKILNAIRRGSIQPFQVMRSLGGPIGVVTNWRAIDRFRRDSDFLKNIQEKLDLTNDQVDSEYELIFGSAVDSAVFEFETVRRAQRTSLRPYNPPKGSAVFIGIDPAGQGRDFACAIALHRHTDDEGQRKYRVCRLYRKRTGTSDQHLNAITTLIEKLSPALVVVEGNGMGVIWNEKLAGLGVHYIESFSTTESSKEVLISRIIIALERNVLELPEGPIIEELLSFRRTEKGRLQASSKAHDDTVMALGLALHAARFAER